MGMLTSSTSVFRASVQLTQSDISGYLQSALARRGYTGVTVEFVYNDNGSSYDRFASPTLAVKLSGNNNGAANSETISRDQIRQTVIAEMLADGLALDESTLSINYSEMTRQVTGSVALLVPRKRN